MKTFDCLVIGGGPGGYAAAIRAAQHGMKVALIEARELGGTCLNRGCIPSKAFLHGVEEARTAQPSSAAPHGEDLYRKISERSQAVVQGLRASLQQWIKAQSIEVFAGKASLEANGVARVQGDAGSTEMQAKNVVLAVGSEPAPLPFWPFDEQTIISSDGVLAMKEMPKTMLVVGGGAVGVEWADVLSGMGVGVKLVEMQSQLLPNEDPAAAKLLENALRAKGVEIALGAQVQPSDKNSYDKVLVAVGRRPRLEGLGLEALGVVLQKGFVRVDETMRSNVPGLYAVGDVNGIAMLAHAAIAQGRCAADHMAGKSAAFHAAAVPRCVYTDPEIASVGMHDAQARAAGIQTASGKFPYAALGKAKCMGSDSGFIKVIAEKASRKVIGVVIAGKEATDLIGEACLIVSLQLTLQDIIRTVHPHPTLCEGLWEAACIADGQGLHGGGPKR